MSRNETILRGLTSFSALEAQMQFSCRDIYWLFVSPWALARETGVVEREPHANDVWLQLRLWSGSRLSRSACRSHTPASFYTSAAVVSSLLIQRAGVPQCIVYSLNRILDRVRPSLLHTTLDLSRSTLLLSREISTPLHCLLALSRMSVTILETDSTLTASSIPH